MIVGVATVTIVRSTRIMKNPRTSAKSAGQGFLSPTSTGAGVVSVSVTGGVNTRPWTITSMSSFTGNDLMAGPPPTHLPEDPAAADLVPGADVMEVVARHPDSPLAWSTTSMTS